MIIIIIIKLNKCFYVQLFTGFSIFGTMYLPFFLTLSLLKIYNKSMFQNINNKNKRTIETRNKEMTLHLKTSIIMSWNFITNISIAIVSIISSSFCHDYNCPCYCNSRLINCSNLFCSPSLSLSLSLSPFLFYTIPFFYF